MKILIIGNRCYWKTWQSKIDSLKEWLDKGPGTKGFQFDLIRTDLGNIPFIPYNDQGQLGIDPEWYNKNVTPLAFGYDICLFVVPRNQWLEPNRARGWRTDYDQGPVELHIGCDEYETRDAGGWSQFPSETSAFFLLAEHEILHALYKISGQADNTHYWWDRGQIERARDEIVLPKNYVISGLLRSLAYLKSLLAKAQAMQTKSQKLAELAKSKLETDFTNDDIVPDEVSCAFAVTTIMREFDGITPIIPGTNQLMTYFETSGRFDRIMEPEAGCIVISATGTNTHPDIIPNGHTGIYLDNNLIMSNDSASGLWKQNYTRESWRNRYYYKGGYPVRLFKYKNENI